jgi:hypothetical protein
MAYACTITWCERRSGQRRNGSRILTIKVSETGAASTDEWSTTGGTGITVRNEAGVDEAPDIPQNGTILLTQATLSAGTGTTILPKFGKSASFSTTNNTLIALTASAASYIHEQSAARFSFDPGATRKLVGRSTPNSAVADHTITTLVEINDGHEV